MSIQTTTPTAEELLTAKVQAFALLHGSAFEAARAWRMIQRDQPWAHTDAFGDELNRLSDLERGVSIAEMEAIVAHHGGKVHPDYLARLDRTKARRAAWLRSLEAQTMQAAA